jgi:hypothetical protein
MILSVNKVFVFNIYKMNVIVNNFYNKIFTKNKKYWLLLCVYNLEGTKKGVPIFRDTLLRELK